MLWCSSTTRRSSSLAWWWRWRVLHTSRISNNKGQGHILFVGNCLGQCSDRHFHNVPVRSHSYNIEEKEKENNDSRPRTRTLLTIHMHCSIVLEGSLAFCNCHWWMVSCRSVPVYFHKSRISNSTVHRDILLFDSHLGFVHLHNVQEWHRN